MSKSQTVIAIILLAAWPLGSNAFAQSGGMPGAGILQNSPSQPATGASQQGSAHSSGLNSSTDTSTTSNTSNQLKNENPPSAGRTNPTTGKGGDLHGSSNEPTTSSNEPQGNPGQTPAVSGLH